MKCVLNIARCTLALLLFAAHSFAEENPQFDREIAPLIKRYCVKCHGPAKQEGKLNLATPGGLVRGGENGAVVIPHDSDGSLLWQRIFNDEMPPESPLTADEKQLFQKWIAAGTPGLKQTNEDSANHWAFTPLSVATLPPKSRTTPSTLLDLFIQQKLEADQLEISDEADRATLIRRVAFDLSGLPPAPEDVAEFVADKSPDAFERLVDRLLASPHFGERLGKIWLDAAGYADSNGYFNADSDRPLAYRYRDYVIRAINADLPYDQFVREQIAGDEISGITAKNGETDAFSENAPTAAQRRIEMLEATHYLRCGQDGTGESDGNDEEVRVDRYTVLETSMQNLATGLLGLTIQCAKCHDHKFEPLPQRDYYAFQAVLIPAFPPAAWVKPNDRFVYAAKPGEFELWESNVASTDAEIKRLSSAIAVWAAQRRPRGAVLFIDDFNQAPEALADKWADTAPGDDAPAGTDPVKLNSREAPGAMVLDSQLHIFEGGTGGDKWLSTKKSFDWTPDVPGASIQVTFDLIEHHIEESKPAERIGYLICLHDFNDSSGQAGGNILIDGHPNAGSAVFIDYPGADSKQIGALGKAGHVPGHNYGVRITNQGEGKFLLENLVDWQAEVNSIVLTEADLPNGGFGFEFCCERSFVIDNVIIESFATAEQGEWKDVFGKELKVQSEQLEAIQKQRKRLGGERPGRIAWVTDIADPPPEVHILQRGNYNTPAELVQPDGFSVLGKRSAGGSADTEHVARGSGRRLEFARWITEPGSSREGLLARVHTNRLWQHHFGRGIVQTADNFGLSGAVPTHPELLDWLARDFVRSNWSAKRVSRSIVASAAYRQQSGADDRRMRFDADASRLSRFPVRRLDAEAIRDSLLFAAGDLDDTMFGPYVPTHRNSNGETIVPEDQAGSRRRSIYLQQKRTQVHTMLQVFDAPSIVFNSTRRPRSTMPLQSLTLLNSEFVLNRARNLEARVQREASTESDRIQRLFVITTGSPATEPQLAASLQFLKQQETTYIPQEHASIKAWVDLSQILLIGNAALYLD